MNYMGGKSRIAKQIVPIIQSYIDDNHITKYAEPFVGGFNVIDKIECEKRLGTDKNKYLMELFKHCQIGLPLYDEISKELYDKARNAWYEDNKRKEFEDWQIGCIGWLCSYSGRGFDGVILLKVLKDEKTEQLRKDIIILNGEQIY